MEGVFYLGCVDLLRESVCSTNGRSQHIEGRFIVCKMDASRAQPKGSQDRQHRTLFLGSSKCSPGTVVILLSINHLKLQGYIIESNITLEVSRHMQQWPCKWVVTVCGWCRKQDHTTTVWWCGLTCMHISIISPI